MKRREFLQISAAALALQHSRSSMAAGSSEDEPRVMTVRGEFSADRIGTMLPHEHVLVDFIGSDQVSPDRYDADDAFRVMLPYLKQARRAGCQTIAECTPAYLGRDPKLLKRLAEASGVTLITNTGYYGARKGKYLPQHALDEGADELAARWTKEWTDGIDGTGIRPGFIKIGVDAGELTDVNRKLVDAAARCHVKTGLTIAGHTVDGKAALQQLDILRNSGVSPSAWIWVHAQNERNSQIHHQLARAGAWVEFDGVRADSMERHVKLVTTLWRAGLLSRILVSHDAGWYSVGELNGGEVHGFDTLFTQFLPALKKAGLSDDEITQLTVTNPGKAFSIAVRPA